MKSFTEIFRECQERLPAFAGAIRWANLHEQESKKGKFVYHASLEKLEWDDAKQSERGFFVSVNPHFCIDFLKYYLLGSKKFGTHWPYLYKFVFKRPVQIFNPCSNTDVWIMLQFLEEPIKKTFEKKCIQIRKRNRIWEEIERPFIYKNVKRSGKFDGYSSFGGITNLLNKDSEDIAMEFYKEYGVFTEANNFSLFNPQEVLIQISEEQERLSI
ncbi:MAG: hypothetical protein LBD41_04995 [Clostridiales Family XIII bacterium]|jgi:hypothetical protein|nr:hypothetical protein [Clostridiales Family XIII bacterium]